MFGKKTTARDVARQSRTQTRHTQAELDRERAALDRQERQLIADIRQAAARGQKPAVNTLTRQLIRTRKLKEQLGATKAQVTATHYQTQVCNSFCCCTFLKQKNLHDLYVCFPSTKQTAATTDTMVRTMGSTTRAMARANALQRPQDVAATMRQYEMQRERMDAAQEMVHDALEGDADEDDEADDVVDQIFDEIGVEVGSQVCFFFPFCVSVFLTFSCCCHRWQMCQRHAWQPQQRVLHRGRRVSRPPATRSSTGCSRRCENASWDRKENNGCGVEDTSVAVRMGKGKGKKKTKRRWVRTEMLWTDTRVGEKGETRGKRRGDRRGTRGVM